MLILALAAVAQATAPAGWSAMLKELDRSLAAYAEPFDEQALAGWDPDTSVVVLGGRAYVAERWLTRGPKHPMHLAFLASVYLMRAERSVESAERRNTGLRTQADAPNVAYSFQESASGDWVHDQGVGGPEVRGWPTFVIAKREGYGGPGVLVPNP